MHEEEMVCWCSSVTRADIVAALEQGAQTWEDIKRTTGACTIGRCREHNPKGT